MPIMQTIGFYAVYFPS